ncbi:MAG: 30S ribosomal protein S12 methylthiotransferase RimO [Eubacteriaceae bacterium]|jgi:ribosomal protein S12 methylthiotransferase|nr:30S ribosomal protein S12 methylthiotransferase RimO [Eubacteriaceae bacterium]
MKPTFYIHTLGCDKNAVDSEKLAFSLQSAGFEPSYAPESADAIIINTCGFIQPAKEESVDALFEALSYKEASPGTVIAAVGCLAQRYKKEIEEGIEGLDLICGVDSADEAAKLLADMFGLSGTQASVQGRALLEPETRHYAYLKISEGCSKFCTFCAIPSIRGPLASQSIGSLVSEAKTLAERGAKELILIAQDTGSYGIDIYGKPMLPSLLSELCSISGINWIRIMYMYPESLNDEIIDAIASLDKVLPYLDIPFQHASDEMLAMMGRQATKESMYGLINKLRRKIPDIAIRSTFICGFPGETRSHAAELMEFLQNAKLDRVGVFEYSREDGTKAYSMPNQVSEKEKQRRRAQIMLLQEEISESSLAERIGTSITAIIDEEEAAGIYVARSYLDAPEVDGCVYIYTQAPLKIGEFCTAHITGSTAHDLEAEI